MARSIIEIQQEILDNITSNENLVNLNSTSKVAIYRLIVFSVAFAIWTLEKLFDTHKTELSTQLFEQKSGILPWYRTMALAFQYGFDLITDTDQFDNGTATADQIANSKIVKYAAVVEGDTKSRVIIKIAGEQDVFLSPINGFEEAAFNSYIDEIRYAGVQVTVINYLPDRLYLDMKIYRDPLVIDVNGNSILYGGKPVETAIKEFMKELPFNGEFIIANLVDKLQKVEGVKIPHMNFTKSSWIDAVVGDYGLPQPIDVKAIPVSGYYQVVNFDSISYVV